MKNIKAFITAVILLISWSSHSEETPPAASFGKTQTVQRPPTPANKGPAVTDSAKDTQGSNSKGQALNQLIGVANMAMGANCASQCSGSGGGCCSMAPMFFLMGAMNFAQAGAQGKTAGQAGMTVGMTDIGLDGSGYDPNAVNDPALKDAQAFMDRVAKGKAGFTYDPKTNTVTTAKGNKVKGSDLNSASSMAAAGIPKGAIDMLMSAEKDIIAKAEKKVGKMNFASGTSSEESSSGGGGGDSSVAASEDPRSAYEPRAGGLGIDRDPAQVAGMQKNYNGDPIGVAGDSIFKMMTRRYKTKESQSSFLEESDLLLQK